MTNGTLQIGAGGVSGSLNESTLIVSNGAAVVFNSSGSQTNGGLISGSGSVTVTGGGSVLLNNGLSTFTGNILVDGGSTLAAQGGNSSSVGSLGNPGAYRTITTTNGSKLTFIAGNIYGNGAAASCKISTVISSNCQFVLNANDANIIGALELDGGTMSVGNGFSSQYQGAILLSNVVIGGASPSTILVTGTDATKNGVMLGAFGTVASADIINNSLHFVVNSTGGSGADLTVSARLVDPPYSSSVGGGNTSANGSLYKDGSGIMLLTAANTYTGPTVVNAGKLVVSSVQGAAGMTNYVDVIDGAALAVFVSGTNQWSPSLAYLGTGGGGITLEFTNLNTPNIAPFNPGSVSVPGPVTVNVSGKVSAAQYRLVANAAGSIGSFSIGTLPSGVVASLVADTDGTTIDLNVSTGNAGPSGAGTITNSISGSNLTLTWPSGQGWRLVSQTNSLSVGLTASGWNTVSGGIDGSNSIAIDPTKPTVFYRLTYP